MNEHNEIFFIESAERQVTNGTDSALLKKGYLAGMLFERHEEHEQILSLSLSLLSLIHI